MYLPFVFGRKSELLALRSANKKYIAGGRIIPVIEPVVKKTHDLLRCLSQLGDDKVKALVIVNPEQGEFKNSDASAWKAELDTVITKYSSLLPAFKCEAKTTYSCIIKFLAEYKERDVALLYSNPSLTDAELHALVTMNNIVFHVSLQGRMTARQRGLLPVSKAVDIVDHFNKQLRNADYLGAEHFTDRHKRYKENGIGFGDYTVTGSLFQAGGGKPGAVAVHAIFKNQKNKDIWVEHFVSNDTDINTGSAGSKYLEAVSKIAASFPMRALEFGSNHALIDFISDHKSGHFPGLGKSKERQIYHHIALMHDVLHGHL